MGHERRETYSFRDLETTPDHPLPLTGYAIFTAPSSSQPGQHWHVGYDIDTGETYCECRERAAEEHKHNCWHQKVIVQKYHYTYWTTAFLKQDGLHLLRVSRAVIRKVIDHGIPEVGGEPWAAMEALTDVIDQRLLEWKSEEKETA